MSISRLGIRGSKAAAGFRPFPRRATSSARPNMTTGPSSNAKAEVPPFGDSGLAVVRSQAGGPRAPTICDRRSFAHSADAGTYTRPCRLRAGRGKDAAVFWRRHHAFAATDSLSRIVAKLRCRSGARGQDPARFEWSAIATPRAVLHGAIFRRPRREKSAARGNGFSCEAAS